MTKRKFMVFTMLVFLLTLGGIGVLIFLPQDTFSNNTEPSLTKVVIPQNAGLGGTAGDLMESQNIEEGSAAKVSFGESESVISILAGDFNGDSREEQLIAYRNLQEIDTPIFLTYADINAAGGYERVWTAPTAASRPSTLLLYSEDLVGDGGMCVLVSGMNNAGAQTLTVFRKNNPFESPVSEPFSKIAEFIIEGSITVEEIQQSRDYQHQARGKSLSISTFGRDYESANMLDQIETSYTYNTVNGLYEQFKRVKIPGRAVEQLRVSELLSAPGRFEEFVDGLWRHSLSNGQNQYVYFNMAKSEMILYFNNTEEVFTWQESSSTRYGLHIIGKNISLTKLRCTVNIELESLETIRLRVFQDAYLRTGPSVVWDGSYKKVHIMETSAAEKRVYPYLEGSYSSSDGRIAFSRDGVYELYSPAGKIIHKGKYVFFTLGKDELLELRSSEPERLVRETLKIDRLENEGIALSRVRIGTRGVQETEMPLSLVKDPG